MKTACLVITLALMVMTVASTRYRRVRRTRKVYEDPKPCDQDCRATCCDGDCKHNAGLKDVCDSECGCGSRKRTLEDPNPCNQCYNECCEGECTAGSEQEDVCLSECGCRKRTLQALKAKRGDEEYPTDTEYYSVSAEECAACKETCHISHSDAVCNEICNC